MKALPSVLRELGIDYARSDELDTDWLTQEPDLIINFVCAVLGTTRADRSDPPIVYLEIGAALGRNIPVLLFVEPGLYASPAVGGIQRVDAALENREALKLHLSQFVLALRAQSVRRTALDRTPGLTEQQLTEARSELTALNVHTLRHPMNAVGPSFELFLSGLFRMANAEVSQSFHGDDGHDLAMWVDEASDVMGGPLHIIIKLWRKHPRGLGRDFWISQARTLTHRASPFGLLVYHIIDEPDSELEIQGRLPIIAISATRLIEELGRQSLARLLISRRNALVHEVPPRG